MRFHKDRDSLATLEASATQTWWCKAAGGRGRGDADTHSLACRPFRLVCPALALKIPSRRQTSLGIVYAMLSESVRNSEPDGMRVRERMSYKYPHSTMQHCIEASVSRPADDQPAECRPCAASYHYFLWKTITPNRRFPSEQIKWRL